MVVRGAVCVYKTYDYVFSFQTESGCYWAVLCDYDLGSHWKRFISHGQWGKLLSEFNRRKIPLHKEEKQELPSFHKKIVQEFIKTGKR